MPGTAPITEARFIMIKWQQQRGSRTTDRLRIQKKKKTHVIIYKMKNNLLNCTAEKNPLIKQILQ